MKLGAGYQWIPPNQRRRRLSIRGELTLALLPTITVLIALAFIDLLSSQRLLFVTLAASAFLIYLDPGHTTNEIRTLVAGQLIGVCAGAITGWFFHPGFVAAGSAMVITIFIMVVGDVVHPPGAATSMLFGLSSDNASQVVLFSAALAMVALLVILQRAMVWLLARLEHPDTPD